MPRAERPKGPGYNEAGDIAVGPLRTVGGRSVVVAVLKTWVDAVLRGVQPAFRRCRALQHWLKVLRPQPAYRRCEEHWWLHDHPELIDSSREPADPSLQTCCLSPPHGKALRAVSFDRRARPRGEQAPRVLGMHWSNGYCIVRLLVSVPVAAAAAWLVRRRRAGALLAWLEGGGGLMLLQVHDVRGLAGGGWFEGSMPLHRLLAQVLLPLESQARRKALAEKVAALSQGGSMAGLVEHMRKRLVLHACEKRCCCPWHLVHGSHRDNYARWYAGWQKRRRVPRLVLAETPGAQAMRPGAEQRRAVER